MQIDPGTRTVLHYRLPELPAHEVLAASPFAGPIWESYCLSQVVKHFTNRGEPRPPLWYWRTMDGEEVDLLVEREGGFIALECKLTEQPKPADMQGIEKLRAYYGPEAVRRAAILCPARGPAEIGNGIVVDDGLHIDEVLT